MDVVLEKLESTAITPKDSNEIKTNFDWLYKNWGKIGSQDERRREILEVQKSNRNSKLDEFRGILELVQAVEESSVFKTFNKAYYRPSIYVAGFNKAPSYKQVLMMSEWLIEKPSDFEENWFVVPAPKGIRVLVVANNGRTRLFTKYGHFLFECRTALPGGNPSCRKSKICVLDCFYQKKGNILYVLDILAWNSQPMTDGELEFRDYWLKSQFFELDDLRGLNKLNELVFSILPKVSCAPEFLKSFLMKPHINKDFNALDGLLFYHKKAHYTSGVTPLVGWLYPFMVPEVLAEDIPVHTAYMIQKPETYTNQAQYIHDFNEKYERKKQKGHPRNRNSAQIIQMDTTDVQQTKTKPEEAKPEAESDEKPKTEEMEAEATSDSTDKAAVLVAGPETTKESTNP